MSDDLISRKDVITIIENMIFEVGKDLSKSYLLQDAKERIRRLNTAFDKEKVIEELKEMATHSASCKNQCEFGSTEYFDYMGAEVAYRTTIEIVEKGGIE